MPFSRVICAIGLIAFSTLAQGETISTSSVGFGTSNNEAMPLSDGLVLVHAMSTYDGFDTENPDDPFAGATGPCFGSMLIKAGVPSGGGHCRYTDTDGGMVVVRWTPEALAEGGMTLGTWRIEGGTGKWAEATGSGTFLAGSDSDGAYRNQIGGEVTMP